MRFYDVYQLFIALQAKDQSNFDLVKVNQEMAFPGFERIFPGLNHQFWKPDICIYITDVKTLASKGS